MRATKRWPVAEAHNLHAQAFQLLSRHDGHGSSRLERENCGACALAGYDDKASSRDNDALLAPNYAGWARAYVQAGLEIPAKYAEAFMAEQMASDNEAYAAALRRDVLTFGVRIARP